LPESPAAPFWFPNLPEKRSAKSCRFASQWPRRKETAAMARRVFEAKFIFDELNILEFLI
jgi:hypothetical protein